ncbi:MAG: glycosyltransferase [Phycisphaeraceae bacterium]|nr:MAG: glycosyltransferase [Phycisphaeraceae bacterium]
MRVLMLGWEFPPFIAGGLGVACYGLTRALDRLGHEVVFVLPRPVDRVAGTHVKLLSPKAITPRGLAAPHSTHDPARAGQPHGTTLIPGLTHAVIHEVPAGFSHPYPGGSPLGVGAAPTNTLPIPADHDPDLQASEATDPTTVPPQPPAPGTAPTGMHLGTGGGAGEGYGGDLFGDADRYARLVVALASRERFDVIHAHDWLTYPAGLAVAKASGKPLIVHVHSTEFDRSGNNVNARVYEVERAGMQGADRVVAVSQLTKSICVRRYGVSPSRVDVVYNGIDRESQQPQEGSRIERDDKIVLFLGRITMQKGPEYFIAAARRVLEKFDKVKFVVAGSGDMALRMVELAAGMGIGSKVLFTGFLRGRDVDRVFAMADCYVMPSVSEPFGIAALEAMHHDVPVIVSKTSGVAEVLSHVLKVDFWDVDEMANKILAVLRHPPLSATMREHGPMELKRLTWREAAERCVRTYEAAVHGSPAHA